MIAVDTNTLARYPVDDPAKGKRPSKISFADKAFSQFGMSISGNCSIISSTSDHHLRYFQAIAGGNCYMPKALPSAYVSAADMPYGRSSDCHDGIARSPAVELRHVHRVTRFEYAVGERVV